MISLSTLRPRVSAEAPNCPNPKIDQALVDAARELCGIAIWQHAQAVPERAVEYEMQPPEQGSVVRLYNVRRDGWPVPHRVAGTTLVLDTPSGPNTVATIVARPALDAKTLPEAVADPYLDGLVSGALYRVLRTPADPWGNPNLAQSHARQFRYWRAQAAAAVNLHHDQSRTARVQARPFARFRSDRWSI